MTSKIGNEFIVASRLNVGVFNDGRFFTVYKLQYTTDRFTYFDDIAFSLYDAAGKELDIGVYVILQKLAIKLVALLSSSMMVAP